MMLRKAILFICITAYWSVQVQAQTLFTYGTKTVSKDEFLKAFNKNPDTSGNRQEKIQQYLDLYINFKLKIQAALDEKLQTSESFQSESDNFKAQLTENYINEQANLGGLIHEAFIRSQKDILLSQVFVEVKKAADSIAAYNQIRQAYNSLQNGQNFAEVAAAFSTDESVRKEKGKVGYITVFSLPYEMENMVYGLKPGSYSTIYRSSIGYHIFRNEGERPSPGKRKIQQILIATPDIYTAEEKKAAAKLADSIYKVIKDGASFDQMADLYSAPNNSYDASNKIEVGVGQYSSDFEEQVFALKQPGDMSKVFETPYGYNIIKLFEVVPAATDENDIMTRATLQEMTTQDNRLYIARRALLQQWKKQTKYTPGTFNKKDMWAYTDSSLKKDKALTAYKTITPQTVLFSFAKEKVTVNDWIKFLSDYRQNTSQAISSPYDKLFTDFSDASCDRYYRAHIEEFNPAIATQVKEFNEANMLFAVMDKHVWSKAAEDSAGLQQQYNQHKAQYLWQPGVSALVISSDSKELLTDSIAPLLRKGTANWRELISNFNEDVLADSSRFENGQLPLRAEIPMKKGYLSEPEASENGDQYTMVYIFETHPQPEQRSFEDARGLVINDYQVVLEEQWIAALKKKYPVKVNEAVLKGL